MVIRQDSSWLLSLLRSLFLHQHADDRPALVNCMYQVGGGTTISHAHTRTLGNRWCSDKQLRRQQVRPKDIHGSLHGRSGSTPKPHLAQTDQRGSFRSAPLRPLCSCSGDVDPRRPPWWDARCWASHLRAVSPLSHAESIGSTTDTRRGCTSANIYSLNTHKEIV